MIKRKPVFAFLLGISFCLSASAADPAPTKKPMKWWDKDGNPHYSNVIPPEYANQDRKERAKDGSIVEIKKTEVLTPAQIQAKEEADLQKRNAERAALEDARRDKTLLNSYSSVKEIDERKSRDVKSFERRISSMEVQIRMTQDTLLGHQKESETRIKSGASKAILDSLRDDINETQQKLAAQNLEMENLKAEKASVEQRYEAEKERYKKLTGKP